MTAFHLNAEKLARDIDQARRAGARDEMSLRQVAREAGVYPSLLTRLHNGQCPDADAFLSLMLWLNPRASLVDYARPGPRPRNRRASVAGSAPAMSQ